MKKVQIKKLLKKYKYSNIRPLDRALCEHVKSLCVYNIISSKDYSLFVDLFHFLKDLEFKMSMLKIKIKLEGIEL